jgi:hypothetical protein
METICKLQVKTNPINALQQIAKEAPTIAKFHQKNIN